MNVRSNIYVHSDIQILELSADQRTDAGSTNSAGERAGGYRYAVADSQRGLFVVQSSNLGVLQKLGVAVAGQERERTSGNAQSEIAHGESAASAPPSGSRDAGVDADGYGCGHVRTEGAKPVAVYLHYGDVDDDFRLRLVNVSEQLAGENHLVRRAAQNQGPLCLK